MCIINLVRLAWQRCMLWWIAPGAWLQLPVPARLPPPPHLPPASAPPAVAQEGLVQHVNEPFLRLFGYRKGELEGSNVMRIMPNPFSAQHDSERLWRGAWAAGRLGHCWCWEGRRAC